MEPMDAQPDGRTDDAIAIVGMACRFPGDADSIENFWEMIRDGKDAWSEIPSDRFNVKGWYHPDPNRPGSVSGLLFSFLLFATRCLLLLHLPCADRSEFSSISAALTL